MRFLILLALLAPIVALGQSTPIGANNSLPADALTPPNDPPVWNETPDVTYTLQSSAAFDLTTVASDPEGDTLTFTEEAGCTLPNGVSVSGNDLAYDGDATATNASGCVLAADDGVNTKVSSPAYSITFQTAVSTPNYDYPRIAQYLIGGGAQSKYGQSSFQAEMAQADLIILNAYPGFSNNGQNLTQIIAGIKAVDSTTTVVFYVEPAAVQNLTVWSTVVTKLEGETGPSGSSNAPDWWAYTGGGSRVGWYSPAPPYSINITENVTADSNGDYLPQWYAQYFIDNFYTGTGVDGWFQDNMNPKPVASADWDGDGTTDSSSDPTVKFNWQTGKSNFIKEARTLGGPDLIIGNATQNWSENPMPTPYDQVMSGLLIEHAMGEVWSIEGTDASGSTNAWGSWTLMMNTYRKFQAAALEPKWGILEMRGVLTDYDFMRYGLCSALMDNGFFSFDDDAAIYTKVPWFDEYNWNLGQPVDPPQTSAYSNGVYVRQFDNGLAVVNPRGNGQQTITLPTAPSGFHWELLNAASYANQDPTVNDGSTVTQITINESDGRIITKVSD